MISCIHPLNIPGIIMPRAMNPVVMAKCAVLCLAFRHVDHVKHIRREAESVAKLFYQYSQIDKQEAVRHGIGQVDVDRIGQVDGNNHGPQPEPESVTGGQNPADNPPGSQGQNPDGSVHKAYFTGGKCQSAGFLGVQQEGRGQFDQLGLAEAVEQQKQQDDTNLFLFEKTVQRCGKTR